jgi:hypothetical protein
MATTTDAPVSGHTHRERMVHEATVMVLYVSIVLLATLVALPEDFTDHGNAALELIALEWGTAIGLALAHWFAFSVAGALLSGGLPSREDLQVVGAQLGGAAIVALVTMVPILVVGRDSDVTAAAFAPALILGLAGFRVARTGGRSVFAAVFAGVLVLVVGLTVATIKALLAGH